MLLNEIRPNVETSADLEEQFFSIEDQGMIFDILRNRMYSNPILAICREITCNARDAHREVGTPDKPIHIHLPTNLDPYYKIRDFGPGISPDRMSNVFIKYTASTKRSNNIQTGGFGLGAKTPFSYSDTFTITTNVNGKQYHYSCFIDSTKVGKLSLMHEAPTSEPNGTEIQIPVNHKDFNNFTTWTEHACRHWDIKPLIKGGTIKWQETAATMEGTNWKIGPYNYNSQIKMIIDSIEYPLEMDALRKYADTKLIDAARGNLFLYFGVGELSLSASREQIYLDEKTQKIICKRLEDIVEEIKQRALVKINACDNLWTANLYYRKELKSAFNELEFLGDMNWRGAKLKDTYLNTTCTVFSFKKGVPSRRFGVSTNPDKITRSTQKHLSFEDDTDLYINDLPLKEPGLRHIKKAFEGNLALTGVQILCPNDKVSLKDIQASDLNLMAPKKLSSITKATGRTYTPSTSRLLVFKFEPSSFAFRQVSYASLEEDTNHKVLSLLTRSGSVPPERYVTLKNKKSLGNNIIKTLTIRYPDHSFYGVDLDTSPKRIDEDFSDMIDIEDFITDTVLNNKLDYTKIKFANGHSHYVDDRMLNCLSKIKPLLNTNSLFLRRLDLHQKVKELRGGDVDLLHLYESYNGDISSKEIGDFLKKHPEFDIMKINKEYDGRYPLLEHISYYDFEDALEHIAHYINLIDLNTKGKTNV